MIFALTGTALLIGKIIVTAGILTPAIIMLVDTIRDLKGARK